MATNFPRQAVATAIVQESFLKVTGLVADCIFPRVQTPCFFQYIDWTNGINIQLVDDAVSCKSDVKEVDPEAFTLVTGKVKDHALSQSMGDCCETLCGGPDLSARKEQGKTVQLLNRLLINREREAVVLATTESNYVAGSGAPDGVKSNEGVMWTITPTNFNDPNFALLKYFQYIQVGNKRTGRRTKAVMSQNKLNAFMSHPDFLGAGCIVDPVTTSSKVAALLGVNEICVADAYYNSAVGPTPTYTSLWPDEYILFTASYDMLTADEQQVGFGFTAYDKGMRVNYYLKEEKGPDAGVQMQKQAHDLTPIVMTYLAATLVKVSV